MKSKVFVTGISGFLGSHIAIQLINKGYAVTGSLRNIKRAAEIETLVRQHSRKDAELHFVEADLQDEKVWLTALKGVEYVFHVASPFPRTLPKNDEELVRPAVDGSLNVLKAATLNKVRRVVMTSSTGAICYGNTKSGKSKTYTETDWTDISDLKDTTPYFRSKTMAEKAAWDYVANTPESPELSVICPGAILGPVLETDFGTSANIVLKPLQGAVPAVPKIGFEIVDVRSVADLHILAMESKEAAGERFAGTSGFLSFQQVAALLKEQYPKRKIPGKTLPNVMVRLFSNIDKSLKPILIDLGVERKVDSSKARNMLGWQPIPIKQSVIDCAESLIALKLA